MPIPSPPVGTALCTPISSRKKEKETHGPARNPGQAEWPQGLVDGRQEQPPAGRAPETRQPEDPGRLVFLGLNPCQEQEALT